MKKLTVLLFFAFTSTAFAQSTLKEDVDMIQAAYGKSKKELMTQYMKITGPQADAFWKVYDEFEAERKQLGQARIKNIAAYAEGYNTMTDEKADGYAKEVLSNLTAYDKLYSKYYNKVKTAAGAMNAMKFLQLEIYLETKVRSEIQSSVPFVGELKASEPHKH